VSCSECGRAQQANVWSSRYNAMSHPIPFMRATNIVAPKGKSKEMPDLEEAIEEDDDAEVVEAPEEEEDELDLKTDKYIKQPKAKSRKAAGKKAAVVEDDDEEESGKAKAKGKGTAAKGRGRPKKS